MKRSSFVLFFFAVVLVVGFVSATNCPPSIPKTYSGTAYDGSGLFNQKLDDAEYPLRAIIGNDIVGYGKVTGGEYSINIEPCFGSTGEVNFIINGIEANQQGEYAGKTDWGAEENLSLVFNPKPPKDDTCGDNSIQLGEECDGVNLGGRNPNECGTGWTGTISCSSTCEIDYSNCSVVKEETTTTSSSSSSSSSSGSHGGGGGGGGGGSIITPTKKISTNSTTNATESGDADLSNLVSETTEGNENVESKGFFRLTGNAISDFARTNVGKGVIVIVAIVLIILVWFFVRRKSNKEM